MAKRIAALKNEAPREVEKFYYPYQDGFIPFLSRYNLPKEELADIYPARR